MSVGLGELWVWKRLKNLNCVSYLLQLELMLFITRRWTIVVFIMRSSTTDGRTALGFPSICRPFGNIYSAWRDLCNSKGISVKLVTNIRRVSGNCWACRCRRSKNKVTCVQMYECYNGGGIHFDGVTCLFSTVFFFTSYRLLNQSRCRIRITSGCDPINESLDMPTYLTPTGLDPVLLCAVKTDFPGRSIQRSRDLSVNKRPDGAKRKTGSMLDYYPTFFIIRH